MLKHRDSHVSYWRRCLKNSKVRTAYFYIAIPVILVLVFRIIPVFVSLGISFTDYDIIRPARYVGLANLDRLIHDEVFWNALWAVAYYTMGTVLPTLFIGLGIALVLFSKWFKGKSVFRVIYFIPVILSMTVVSLVFAWLLDPTFGVMNYFLETLGLPSQGFLADPNQAMPCIIGISVWKGIGYVMVIYLAALTSIPPNLYEAATLDGANRIQKFRYVTWPLLKPATLFIGLGIALVLFSKWFKGKSVFRVIYF
ncbi:sugar ABC transporter permease, partial [Candidatus Aerophobetes bacterium]|nr:sugar ABC transporter permease [Candidatus Aerophobetes bacterium]